MLENNENKNQEIHYGNNIQNQDVEKQSQLFLILGIILAFCCNLYFGVAVILINELKYKPALRNGDARGAKNTKTIIIGLLISGVILGLFSNVLMYVLEYYAESV